MIGKVPHIEVKPTLEAAIEQGVGATAPLFQRASINLDSRPPTLPRCPGGCPAPLPISPLFTRIESIP